MGLVPTHLMNSSLKSLSLISARQEALADNIANMHTPGYRRKDIDFSQYLSTTPNTRLEAKMVEKYGTAPVSSTSSESDKISVEDELSKMQENYLYYAAASRQLSNTITQIRTVLNVQTS